MRRIAIALGIFVIIVVGAVLIFAATFDVNRYRGRIQAELEKRLGRPVTLGQMHLGLFPPRFRAQDVIIADDPRFSRDVPFVKAGEVDVSVQLLPLLRKQMEIDSLDLQRPNVNLIKNQGGEWNFASLGSSGEVSGEPSAKPTAPAAPETTSNKPAPPQQPPQGEPQQSSQRRFSLGKLTVEDGQVSLLDQSEGKIPTVYDHIDVTLNNLSPGRPFNLDASVHMAGGGSKTINLQGDGGPLVQSDLTRTPFKGTLKVNQVGLADLTKFLNAPALNGSDGTLTGETKISSKDGILSAQGQTAIQSLKIHGMELGYPVSARYDLSNNFPGEFLTIQDLQLKLGSTPLDLSGTISSKLTPSRIDLNLRANNVSLAEAGKLLAASGIALSQDTSVTGNANVNIRATGAANKPALNGTVLARNVQMTGKQIAKPVQVPSVNLNLTPAEVRSDPFNIVSDGTTVVAQLTARNYLSPSPLVDTTVRATNAQLPALLSIARAYGVTSLDKVNGSGVLNMNMHAAGPVQSITTANIIRALSGTINVNFNNVKYSGANIGHELASIAGFLNGGSAVQSTSGGISNILKMTGDIVVTNGIAKTDNIQAQFDIGNVGLAGTANLATEALNLRAVAVISQGVSQKVGGQNVGGFMKTALSNEKGELVIPALVTGTLSSPRFEPDVQQIAQMRLKGLMPDINNPASVAATVQNLLGGPKNPPDNNQENAQQPQDPLQQFLGLLGKKKQKDQPQRR
jgi:AsmA protein